MFKDFFKKKALVTAVTGAFLLLGYGLLTRSGQLEDSCLEVRKQARAAGLEVKRKLDGGDTNIDFARLSRLRLRVEQDCPARKKVSNTGRQKDGGGVDRLRVEPLVIETGAGKQSLGVEIADTPETQVRGLMFRKEMGDDEGMLFIYPVVKEITMWMKNTHLSLDMVFISEKGIVSHIAYSAVPFSLETISSNGPAKAILEIKAGIADKLGLKIGDRVSHSAFQ